MRNKIAVAVRDTLLSLGCSTVTIETIETTRNHPRVSVGGVIEIEIAGVTVSRHIKAGTPFAEVDALLCGAADQLDAALEFKQTGRFTT